MNTVRLVLPVREWMHSPVLRQRSTLLFAAFVGYPLIATWFVNQQFRPVPLEPHGTIGPAGRAALQHNLTWLDWAFVAYFGAAWAVGLWMILRPRVTRRPLAITAAIALVAGLSVAIWLETTLPSDTDNLFQAVFGVGLSEEVSKMLPVLAAIVVLPAYKSDRAAEIWELRPRDFLYIGLVSGIVFGCAEGVEYIVGSQNRIIDGNESIFGLTTTVCLRLITDPINHGIWAGITCFFLGLAVRRARRAGACTAAGIVREAWLVAIGLGLTATLHGLHDFVGNLAADAAIDIASALLLIAYSTAGDRVEEGVLTMPKPSWTGRLVDATRRVAAPPPLPAPTQSPGSNWYPAPAPNAWSPNGASPNAWSPSGSSPNGWSPDRWSPNASSPNGWSPSGSAAVAAPSAPPNRYAPPTPWPPAYQSAPPRS